MYGLILIVHVYIYGQSIMNVETLDNSTYRIFISIRNIKLLTEASIDELNTLQQEFALESAFSHPWSVAKVKPVRLVILLCEIMDAFLSTKNSWTYWNRGKQQMVQKFLGDGRYPKFENCWWISNHSTRHWKFWEIQTGTFVRIQVSVHTTREKFENATFTGHFGYVLEENSSM